MQKTSSLYENAFNFENERDKGGCPIITNDQYVWEEDCVKDQIKVWCIW